MSNCVSSLTEKEKTDRHTIFCQMYRDTTVLYEALMLQLAEKDLLVSDDNVRICENLRVAHLLQ